jgi:hypothetical protein
MEEVDYGPLEKLIGTWTGNKGMDIAPDNPGLEHNPYHETIVYTEGGNLKNAKSQELSVVHYRQIVKRNSDNGIFHDQTGYWLWDPREKVVMHSLVIPRGLCLLAGSVYEDKLDEEGNTVIKVEAGMNNSDWGIAQSPYLQKNALTTGFEQTIKVKENKLWYFQNTMLEIYGRVIDHTDESSLVRI